MTEEKFLNGSYYEEQYANIDSTYFNLYVLNTIPQPAIDQNQYYVDLAITLFRLEPNAKILEAGCGVGHAISSWKKRGFICKGIEISPTAKRLSPHRDDIILGNVNDLSIFKDDQFDLVFSHGMLEHIDVSFLPNTIKELYRVGLRQYHIISVDPESMAKDPGHITIREPKWWMEQFGKYSGKFYMVGILPDILMEEEREPILFAAPAGLSTLPMRRFFQKRAQK